MKTSQHELALAATTALRNADAFAKLPSARQREVNAHLQSIERHLGADPYASVMETPQDLQRRLSAFQPSRQGATNQSGTESTQNSTTPTTKRSSATETIGSRVADTLEAVDFPGFISGLVNGTFQAIVNATIQQLHEYADLIANLSKSVDEFTQDNVTKGQARQYLLDKHRNDLLLNVPGPGEEGEPQLIPNPDSEGQSPAWLTAYGLEGKSLTGELTEGALLNAGMRATAEDRLQTLATMVLLGINRIVVKEGHIRAKMQFHAVARDQTTAEIANIGAVQQGSIAQRQSTATSVMAQVSTVKANAQAESGIRADLMGEVHIVFGTETFPLDRFANGPLVEVINRHARWRPEGEQTRNTTGSRNVSEGETATATTPSGATEQS